MNRTRRGIWFVLNICFVCMIFAMPVSAKGKSAAKKNVPKKIVLNRTELLLYPGEERKLRVEYIKPEKASAKVVWKSKRKAVAAISPKGELKAGKPGKTTITAISKKNAKLKAVVKVIVKKRPEKKEKECVFGVKRQESNSLLNNYARMQRLDSVVFRSKEDILTYIKEAYMEDYTYNKYSFYYKKKINWNERKWRNMLSWTFLSEYFGMDFKKQSLVVFFDRNTNIVSLQTRFDDAGKLQGIIRFRPRSSEPLEPGIAVPAVITYDATTLKISKQDEAMIDYYQFQAVEE